jgi:general secretion pathway protein G
MIEILAVIVVIAILIALLLPAINGAQRTARITQVRTEISVLESAVATFKTSYGIQPPSGIVLYETAAGWTTDPTSRAAIRQMWPQFDFTYGTAGQIDLNGDSSFTSVQLTPAESLIFFLGGMPTKSVVNGKNVFTLTGFSKSPLYPFAPATTGVKRDPSIYEFDVSRLTDGNSNGFPEYFDPLPGQTTPYAYYSGYEGDGYRPGEFGNQGLSEPYRQATLNTAPPWKMKSFQLVSPGFDHQFGFGGAFVADGVAANRLPFDATQYPNTFTTSTPTTATRNFESDNITNFFGNTLGGGK